MYLIDEAFFRLIDVNSDIGRLIDLFIDSIGFRHNAANKLQNLFNKEDWQ